MLGATWLGLFREEYKNVKSLFARPCDPKSDPSEKMSPGKKTFKGAVQLVY